MRQTKKMMLFMTLLMAGLTIQCQQNDQDAIALKMIEGMQGALHLNRLKQQQLTVSANQQMTDSLMLQVNESKSLFTRLLDEYIGNLGQVYEKKAGLFGGYKVTYSISSKADQSSAITPNQYALLMQTLHNASQQSDWGKTVTIIFPVISHENRATVERDLSLNDIITGLKQVPLRAGYSTAAIVGGVAATAAIASGAYLLYNNMDALRNSVSSIENYFSGSSALDKMPESDSNKIEANKFIAEANKFIAIANGTAAVEPTPVVEAEPSFFQKQLNAMTEARTVPYQAGNVDAENYGLIGYNDAEALGAVAGAGALAAGAARMASSNATRYQTAADAADAAYKAEYTANVARTKALSDTALVEKNLTMARTASDTQRAAEVAEAAKAAQYQAGKRGMYTEMEAIQAGHAARDLAMKEAAAKAIVPYNPAKAIVPYNPTVAQQAGSRSVSPNWAANFENLPTNYIK